MGPLAHLLSCTTELCPHFIQGGAGAWEDFSHISAAEPGWAWWVGGWWLDPSPWGPAGLTPPQMHALLEGRSRGDGLHVSWGDGVGHLVSSSGRPAWQGCGAPEAVGEQATGAFPASASI